MDDIPWFEPVDEEEDRALTPELLQLTRYNIEIANRIVARFGSDIYARFGFYEVPASALDDIAVQNQRIAHRIASMLTRNRFGQNIIILQRIQQLLAKGATFLPFEPAYDAYRPPSTIAADLLARLGGAQRAVERRGRAFH